MSEYLAEGRGQHITPNLPAGINIVYDRVVAVLATDNPSFDKKKFAEACVPEQLYHR